jgi:uncharacterized protein (AIM24 family)
LNRFSYCIEVKKELFVQKGKMIAYYGALRFESLGSSLLDILVKESFNAPLYVHDFIVVTGNGKLVLGDKGNDIASYDLENGNLTVKSSHLLGFEPGLACQECVIPGYLTLLGTGKFLASSNGPVHFMEPPVRVDEQAILGWADLPCPAFQSDYQYVRGALQAVGALVGVTRSGEEKQIDFTGQGTVLIQSSEAELVGRSTVQSLIAQISGLHQGDLQQLAVAVNNRLGNR